MADTKKKKYSQEDVKKMLWKFCLNHEEEYQRDLLCSILEEHNVDDLVKTNQSLHDYCLLGEQHEKYVEAVKWLNEKYKLDLE